MTETEYQTKMQQFRELTEKRDALLRARVFEFDMHEWNRLSGEIHAVSAERTELGVALYDHIHGGITVAEALAR